MGIGKWCGTLGLKFPWHEDTSNPMWTNISFYFCPLTSIAYCLEMPVAFYINYFGTYIEETSQILVRPHSSASILCASTLFFSTVSVFGILASS
jgi:hypothetical protein